MSEEMEAFAARLRAEVKRAGGPKAFAERVEIPLSTLNTYLSGAAEPKITAVIRIARALGKSVAELLSSRPESESPASQTEADSVAVRMLNVVASAGPGYVNDAPGDLATMPFSRTLLGELGVRQRDARFMVARGDSMEPTIKDGSMVLVDVSISRARDDGIYVVVVGNELRIKRIGRGLFGSLNLVSDNERYPNETLAAPEAEGLTIVGKVVWAGGKI